MKLSELVFQCIKYGAYLSDTNFLYDAFMNGDFDNDVEYKDAIDKVWFPLNEALHRLSVKDKVPNRVVELSVDGNVATIKEDATDKNRNIAIRNVRNVFQGSKKIAHRRVGNMFILYGFDSSKPIFAEYKVDIPNFNSLNDVDLGEEYGISETACSFIIEYVKSGLLEEVAPEQAYQHRTVAEQYFADLDTYNNGFEQMVVQSVYRIGE